MFFTLLATNFALASLVSFLAVRFFDRPMGAIFERIIGDKISSAWHSYVRFAAYVVGVRIYNIKR